MNRLRALPLLTLVVGACAAPPSPSSPAPLAADTVELRIASTTDVHGRLRGWDYFGDRPDTLYSLARAATVVDSLRSAHPDAVVLVDAGDLLQGNPLAYVAARVSADSTSPIIAAMNAMGYDAAAVGNHEFNYGLEVFGRAVEQAGFPFLAANARTPAGVRAYSAFTIVERQGVRVGIVGVTTPGSMIWDRDHLRGRLEIGDAVPAARHAVAEARRAGADVIVLVAHSGLDGESSYDTVSTGVASENVAARIAREVDGIDLLVYGHSHRWMADTTIDGTLLMQPRNWARSVGVAELRLARDCAADAIPGGCRWRVLDKSGTLVPTAGHPEDPEVLAATERHHRETVAYATTPIGTTTTRWRSDSARVVDTPLIDLILEVERRATGADLASTAAFTLGASLDSGAITVAELARLYPYDNTLRAVRISGEQLRRYLEYSARYYNTLGTSEPLVNPEIPGYNFDMVAGVDYVIDLSQPIGERITHLEYQGRPVTPTDSFTLALNNYRQTGGGGYAMLQGAPVVHDEGEEIRQLLIDEVRRRGTLDPADYFTPNWRLVPDSAVAAAYRAMHPAARTAADRR